ncbi:MAG TPA: hypothetical protein VMG62_07100, partial [Solirubrobacteraceae bacterium]|nr:hypothetical protein [Solirubrobacteraceae bacterium]
SEEHGTFTVEYTLPEPALNDSVKLLFEGEATGLTTVTLANVAVGRHAAIVNPADPIEHAEVESSSPLKLKSDKYKLTLSYQDSAGNPQASSSAISLTIDRRCKAGHYASSGGEEPCQEATPGHYVAAVGAEAQLPCLVGTYSSEAAATLCLPSPAGHYAPAASPGAIACPPGTHDPDTHSTSEAACKPDVPGTWSELGASEATLCEPGTYAVEYESHTCTPAELGHFVEVQGASAQRPCAPGTYSNETQTAHCKLAPLDTYALEGAIEPTACPAGTRTLSEGQSECTPVPPAAPATTSGGGSTTIDSTTINNTFLTSTAAPLVRAPAPAPTITGLRIDRTRIHRATLAGATAAKHGAEVSYRLSARAKVRYTLLRSASAHGKSCTGRHARCHTVSALTSATLRAGRQRASLVSILAGVRARHGARHAHRALSPGRYVLQAQALGAAGARSKVASVAFTILAR